MKKGILIKSIIIGLLPVLLWTSFSLFYYGFPFPNTAYAKLGTGLPYVELMSQGFQYFLNSIDKDPLTLGLIVLSLFLSWKTTPQAKMISLGVILYLCYILSVGGDFMSGRLFSAPFISACALVSRLDFCKKRLQILTFLCIVLGCLSIQSTLLSDSSYSSRYASQVNGIADERGIYYPDWGLLVAKRYTYQYFDWQQEAPAVYVTCGLLGFTGLAQGPSVHLVDNCGLADPLLSKLPTEYDPEWRIGHFNRSIPVGYIESIEQDTNLIAHPSTRFYYDAIRLVTRGNLFDKERMLTILKLNLGLIPKPILPMPDQVGQRKHKNYALVALQRK